MTQTHLYSSIFQPIGDEGILQIAGRDAKKLLQGQLTCDLEKTTPTQAQMGALCNVQGRVISIFRLFNYQDKYYLILPLSTLQKTQETLKKYAVFYSVELTDVSHDYSLFYAAKSPKKEFESIPDKSLAVQSVEDSFVTKLSDQDDYLIFTRTTPAVKTISNDPWLKFHVRAVIPRLCATTIEKFLPHDLNLPQLQAVDFTKGCYTGQEIIARMHYRAKIKKHLYAARIQAAVMPEIFADVFINGHPCGVIVNCISTAENSFDVLLITDEESFSSHKIYLEDPHVFFAPLPIPYALTKVNHE